MKPTDITIDLETLALSSNAAILQIGAVAWDREAIDDPFLDDRVFEGCVDIRSCIKDGFDIEESTLAWWREKPEHVKSSVLTPSAHPLDEVLVAFGIWLREYQEEMKPTPITLWANGSDFDMGILRNAFNRYEMKLPLEHAAVRDARTFIIEVGLRKLFDDHVESEAARRCPSHIYQKLKRLPGYDNLKHNAVYDARLTTWQVWQLLKKL